MFYNKKQFSKTSDKKVLHKVGKNWVAISLATLMAIGGVSAFKSVSAHADTDNANTHINNTNTLKERLNSSLHQVDSTQQPQTQVRQQRPNQGSANNISQQANTLHNRILANAAQNLGANQQPQIQRTGDNHQGAQVSTPQLYQVGGAAAHTNQLNYSDVPVTVAYANSDGSIQKHINYLGSLSDNILESSVDVSASAGSTASMSSVSFDSSNYSEAATELSATVQPGSVSWGGTSVGVSYGGSVKSGKSFANWDTTNQRPLIVLTPKNAAGSLTVDFVDETGSTISSENFSSYSAGVGDYFNVLSNASNTSIQYQLSGMANPANSGAFYTLDSNTTSQGDTLGEYQIPSSSEVVTVPVAGKYTSNAASGSGHSNEADITFKFTDRNGSASSTTAQIFMNSANGNGQIGQSYAITPAEFYSGGSYANTSVSVKTGKTTKTEAISSLLANYAASGSDTPVFLLDPGSSASANGADASVSNSSGGSGSTATLNFTPQSDFTPDPAAAAINVQYINQNGSYVSENGGLSTNSVNAGTIDVADSNYGSYINVNASSGANSKVTSASSNSNAIDTPAGYTLNPNQQLKYKIGTTNTVQLYVTGEEVSGSVYVSPTITSGKDKVSGANSVASSAVTGRVGDTDVVYAQKFTSDVQSANSAAISNASGKGIDAKPASQVILFGYSSAAGGNDAAIYTYSNNDGTITSSATNSSAGIAFNYSLSTHNQNDTKLYTDTIHYVSYSDLHRGAGDGMTESNFENDQIDYMTGTDLNNGNNLNGQFKTQITLKGTTGTTIPSNAEQENVPRGYQFYKILKVNNSGTAAPTQFGNGDSQGNNNEVVEVIPDASNITFTYQDQDGHVLNQYTAHGNVDLSGNDKKYIGTTNILQSDTNNGNDLYHQESNPQYSTNYGQNIPMSAILNQISDDQANSSNSKTLGIPKGYAASALYSDSSNNALWNPSNDSGYNKYNGVKFDRDPHHITVMVAGDQLKDTDNQDSEFITIHELNVNGVETNHYTIQDNLPGRIGDSYTLYGHNFTPSGYALLTGGNYRSDQRTGQFALNGINNNVSSSNGTDLDHEDFYYQQQKNTNVKPVTVSYLDDDTGASVATEVLTPKSGSYVGQVVSVSDTDTNNFNPNPTYGYNNPPEGYVVDPAQNLNAVLSAADNNQVIVHVHKPELDAAGIVTIHQHMTDGNGQGHDVYLHKSVVGKKGTSNALNPSDYPVAGYDESNDAGVTATFNNDGTVTLQQNGENNVNSVDGKITNQINWNYTAKNSSATPNVAPGNPKQPGPYAPLDPTDPQPIYVNYFDENGKPIQINKSGTSQTGTPSDDQIRVNGEMGQTISDINAAALSAQNGDLGSYVLTPNQQLRYTITNQGRQVNLHLETKEANYKTETINVYSDGNAKPLHSYTVGVNPDQTANVNFDDYLPTGYVSDATKQNNNGLTGVDDTNYTLVNQNGQLYLQTIDGKGDISLQSAPGNISYYVKKSTKGTNNPTVQPLTVYYYNKLGQKISGPYQVTGQMGSDVDISNGAHQGAGGASISAPTGYSFNGETGNTSYTLSNEPQEADLILNGNNDKSNTYNVVIHKIESNGTIDNPSDVKVAHNYGSDFTVKPTESGIEPDGYNAFSQSQNPNNKSDTITPLNANDTKYDPASGTINYYYYQSPASSDTDPLLVQYRDINSGDIVSDGYVAGQKKGSTIADLMSTVPFKNNDYELIPGQNKSYTFNTQAGGQTLTNPVATFNVEGKETTDNSLSVKHPLTVHVIEKHLDGSQTSNSDPYKDISQIPGHNNALDPYRIGQTVQIDASSFTPTGYQESDTNHPQDVAITTKGDTPNNLYFYYDQNQNNESGNLTLQFMNQNGQFVGSNGQLTTNNTNYQINNSNQLFGQSVNVVDPVAQDNYGANGINVPSGYTLDPGQQTTYKFDRGDHNVILLVHGNYVNPSDDQSNRQVTVHIYENGSDTGQTRTIYMNSNLQPGLSVGDTYELEAGRFTPQGYAVHSYSGKGITDEPQKIQIQPDGVSQPSVNFNYDSVTNRGGDLTVKYFNQHGQQVGYSDTIPGNVNSDIDVTDPSKGGEAVPNGYGLDTKNYPNQPTNYKFSKQSNTVNLHVTGNTVSDHLQVKKVYQNSDGRISVSDGQITLPKEQVGDEYTLNPADSRLLSVKSGYSPDYQRTGDVNVLIEPNGAFAVTPSESGNSKRYYHTVTLFYDDQTVNAAPVTIHYQNQNGQFVGSPVTLNGDVSDTLNLSDSNDSKPGSISFGSANKGTADEAAPIVPDGYHINEDTKNGFVTFGNSPQNVVVKVQGNLMKNSKNFALNVVTEDANGNRTGSDVVNVGINGRVGDQVRISPFGFTKNGDIRSINDAKTHGNPDGTVSGKQFSQPNGFHVTNSDNDVVDTINADGSLSPLTSNTFTYQQGFSSVQIGAMEVKYIDSDNTVIDSEETEGIVGGTNVTGDTYDLTPYVNDVPETVASSYDVVSNSPITADTEKGTPVKTSDYANNAFTGSPSNPKVYYVHVKKTNDGPIVVD